MFSGGSSWPESPSGNGSEIAETAELRSRVSGDLRRCSLGQGGRPGGFASVYGGSVAGGGRRWPEISGRVGRVARVLSPSGEISGIFQNFEKKPSIYRKIP